MMPSPPKDLERAPAPGEKGCYNWARYTRTIHNSNLRANFLHPTIVDPPLHMHKDT